MPTSYQAYRQRIHELNQTIKQLAAMTKQAKAMKAKAKNDLKAELLANAQANLDATTPQPLSIRSAIAAGLVKAE